MSPSFPVDLKKHRNIDMSLLVRAILYINNMKNITYNISMSHIWDDKIRIE